MAFPLSKIRLLSDYGGQFVLSVMCLGAECRHERPIPAQVLARRVGSEARVAEVVQRLRCSRCRGRRVQVSVVGIPR